MVYTWRAVTKLSHIRIISVIQNMLKLTFVCSKTLKGQSIATKMIGNFNNIGLNYKVTVIWIHLCLSKFKC